MIAGNDRVALIPNQAYLSVQQFLLRIQHVEYRARPDRRFLLDPFQGNFPGADFRLARLYAGALGKQLFETALRIFDRRAAGFLDAGKDKGKAEKLTGLVSWDTERKMLDKNMHRRTEQLE